MTEGYADGTSGWSGTETSRARVVADDASGATAQRQAWVLLRLGTAGNPLAASWGPRGLTVKELRAIQKEWHHGMASAVLTNLHKAGKIARLAEVREGCKVYVLPEYVNGRETEAYASRSKKPTRDELRAEVRRRISDAYYDARNNHLTMEDAADNAADSVMSLLYP